VNKHLDRPEHKRHALLHASACSIEVPTPEQILFALGPCPLSKKIVLCPVGSPCANAPVVAVHATTQSKGPPRVWSPPRGARSHAPAVGTQPPRPLARIGHPSCEARCVTHVSATRAAMPGHDTSFASVLVRGARVARGVAPRHGKRQVPLMHGERQVDLLPVSAHV